MEIFRLLTCTICGEETLGNPGWFLVTQDYWQDKLRIMHWNDRLAGREGVHCACTAEHMQELVVHWMTTGSLQYPFARMGDECAAHELRLAQLASPDGEAFGMRQIGELSVHRESLQRALSENPESLRTILEALCAALQPEGGRADPRPGSPYIGHSFAHQA